MQVFPCCTGNKTAMIKNDKLKSYNKMKKKASLAWEETGRWVLFLIIIVIILIVVFILFVGIGNVWDKIAEVLKLGAG